MSTNTHDFSSPAAKRKFRRRLRRHLQVNPAPHIEQFAGRIIKRKAWWTNAVLKARASEPRRRLPDEIRQAAADNLRAARASRIMTVHFMQYGHTACMMPGIPKDWPDGHKWSSYWAHVNCKTCLAGKDVPATFSLSPDGKSITCLRCKKESFHPEDVRNHYCGHCHVFHDDLWPPARRWWIENPDK